MNRLVFIIWLGIEFLDMDPRALKIFKNGLFMAHLVSKCLKLEINNGDLQNCELHLEKLSNFNENFLTSYRTSQHKMFQILKSS